MVRSHLELLEGQSLPWWAGIAWSIPSRHAVVILPLGLHRLAAFVRRSWHDFRLGAFESELDKAIADGIQIGLKQSEPRTFAARASGRAEGFQEGHAAGFKDGAEAESKALRDFLAKELGRPL